jgi:hypothetical protein
VNTASASAAARAFQPTRTSSVAVASSPVYRRFADRLSRRFASNLTPLAFTALVAAAGMERRRRGCPERAGGIGVPGRREGAAVPALVLTKRSPDSSRLNKKRRPEAPFLGVDLHP